MNAAMETLSPQVKEGVRHLIEQGWFRDVDSVIDEALRRYLESHTTELMEHFVKDDINWGLHGAE